MSASPFNFRLVSEGDTEALLTLRAAFFQSQVDAGMLDIPLDIDATLSRTTAAILRGGRSHCIIADSSSGIAAYIYFVIRSVPGVEKSAIGSIEEIYVDPSAKRQGLAGRLVKMALDAMHELNVDRIQARVLAANDPAVAFWEKERFAQNVHILEFPVDKA